MSLTAGNTKRLKRDEIPQSNFCILLSLEDRKSPWLVGNSIYPCITTLSFKILLPTVLPCLQTSQPLALVSHSAMSHLQSWDHILEDFGSFTQATTGPTALRMSSPYYSSREETPKIVTITFRLTEIRGRQQPSMQASTFPDTPVSSSALLHLKMAITAQCTVRKLVFSPNLDWF